MQINHLAGLTRPSRERRAKDWWTLAKNATLGPFYVQHGTVAGNKVGIAAPYAQIVKPNYTDMDGVAMLSADLTFNPGSSGNDELLIAVA
jgi:hypothetical protein